MSFSQIFVATLLICGVNLLVPTDVSAEGWGTVTGQFVYDGPVPEKVIQRKKGDASIKDAAVCAKMDHYNNDLVINPENNGIQNAFMFLKKAKVIHPDLKSSKEKTVVFDQKGCTFIPHAMVVRTDQKVLVKSNDPVGHNTHTNPFRNEPVNFMMNPNDRKGTEVANVIGEKYPTKVTCDIHPWMTAYWLIVDHPYAVVTDKDGKFTIKNLPAGKNVFGSWHEKSGHLEKTITVDVKAGETVDLGKIKIKASKFK